MVIGVMGKTRKLVVGGALLAFALLSFGGQETALPTPKIRPDVTHILVTRIDWRVGTRKQSITLQGTASVGYVNGDGTFIGLDDVMATWDNATIKANLTNAEKAALVSIQKKVKNALVAKYAAQ